MSLHATYFDSVINYKICFQNLTVSEYNKLFDFLLTKFNDNSYDFVNTELNHNMYSAVWLKFNDEKDELKFKLLWEHSGN